MTRMVADWAHAAYEASRRHDMEGIYGVLAELVPHGRPAMDEALCNWMDRTLYVMREAGAAPAGELMQLEMETDGTGEVDDIDELRAEVAWAGRMFIAHVRHDQVMWEALWATVPADPESITDYIMVVLTTMTTTAAAYAETAEPDECCPLHRWYSGDPELSAARLAVAYLN